MKIYTIILPWDLKIEEMCDKELAKFSEIILCIIASILKGACSVSKWLKICIKEKKYEESKLICIEYPRYVRYRTRNFIYLLKCSLPDRLEKIHIAAMFYLEKLLNREMM